MKGIRQRGRDLFDQQFDQIERLVHAVAAQRRLRAYEREELYSQVMLKIVEDDFAALRQFEGRSSWKTYLALMIHRVLLDHRVREWGRWRPCAASQRLGPTAVLLDRRINRDGRAPAEAIRELATRGSGTRVDDLEQLADQIPRRPRRKFLRSDALLDNAVGDDNADRRLEPADRKRCCIRLKTTLAAALQGLTEQERRILNLRFGRGWTVGRIADRERLPARPLFRRFQQVLGRLRRQLEQAGLDWTEIAGIVNDRESDLEIELVQSSHCGLRR